MAKKEVVLTEKQIGELIGLYTQALTDKEIALYFGLTERALKRYLRRRENADIRQKIEAQKVTAKARMRRALYDKGIGRDFKPGSPKIIEDGKITSEGEPGQVAAPGDLGAMKFWLLNCDDTKEWRDVRQTQLAGPEGKSLTFHVENMSRVELIDYIVEGIKDGLIPTDKVIPQIESPKEVSRVVEADFSVES